MQFKQRMAGFGGVVVSDTWLANQFTQGELRWLKSQFDVFGGNSNVIPPSELAARISDLNLFQRPPSLHEIETLLGRIGSGFQHGIDFEGFLRLYVDLESSGNLKVNPSMQSSAFLRNSATTLLHTISDSEKKAYVDHINTYLDGDPVLKKYLPIDPSTNDLFEIVKDGIILCKLINVAVPGTIDERALNVKENLNPWERVANQSLCLNSAKAIGCSVVNIGTEDLMSGKPHLVLGLISQIVKIQLLGYVNVKRTPELVEMVEDKAEVEELLQLPAEKVLLRWMNFHLKKGGYEKAVLNFSSDVKDGEAYTVLLHELAPESCSLSPMDINDPLDRANAILSQADLIGCQKYVSPKDIVEGSTNLNLAFVAHLFHKRNGLSLQKSTISFAEMNVDDDEQDSREERAFRMWINSLGTETYVNNLFEDVRDGWLLLEALDKVRPGVVNWKIANRPPLKMPFKKVENCNQVIEIGRGLKFSLVNVAGHDIVQGNKKLILAYLWQLMQYSILQFLKNLKLKGREVSDEDILSWANSKVKNTGRTSFIRSFKDKSLSTGIFFLDLLAAVDPKVVDLALVTKGDTEEEKKQNANYVISVARKLGCSIFLLWDDIVEVRPKMILTLIASIASSSK